MTLTSTSALREITPCRPPSLLGATRELGAAAQQERQQRIDALRREIDDTTRMIKNVVRSFALFDKPTKDLVGEINDERNELHKRESQLEAQLAEVGEENQQAANPDLVDALPMDEVRVEELPEDVAR